MLLDPQLMLGICSFSILVLHETLPVPISMHITETMIWKEERSKIRAVQMENLRWLLDIRKMDRVLNAWMKELYVV